MVVNLSFTEVLIFEAVVLTLLFFAISRWSKSTEKARPTPKLEDSRTRVLVILMAGSLFGIVSLISVHNGYRPPVYFLVLASLAVLVGFMRPGGRSHTALLWILGIVLILLPITIYANNGFSDFGTDQAAILRDAASIVDSGQIVSPGGPRATYYDPFPHATLLLTSISLLTGDVSAFVVMASMGVLLAGIATYITVGEIRGGRSRDGRTPLALILPISIPPLPFFVMVPRLTSIILAILIVYLVLKLIRRRNTLFYVPLLVVLIMMVVLHASGPILILAIFGPLALLSVLSPWREKIPRHFRSLTLLVLVVMLSYWIYNYSVLVTVLGPAVDFIDTIGDYLARTGLPVYESARPYLASTSSPTLVALPWAIPVGVATGHLMSKIRDAVGGDGVSSNLGLSDSVTNSASIAGLALVAASFPLALHGTYSYLIIPAYATLLIAMLLILTRFGVPKGLRGGQAFTLVIAATLVFTGSSSPTWAPIENPDFPQRVYIQNEAAYTEGFGRLLPTGTPLEVVLDSHAYLNLPEDVVIRGPNLRDSRQILLEIEAGTPIDSVTVSDGTYIVVQSGKLSAQQNQLYNLVASSGRYVIIMPPM